MIGSLLGLFTSVSRAHNAAFGIAFPGNSFSKNAQLRRANNLTMYKISIAQQGYYKKLLDKNIKNSFNILYTAFTTLIPHKIPSTLEFKRAVTL